MFEKTSSLYFQKFGTVYDTPISNADPSLICTQKELFGKEVFYFNSYNCNVYIELTSGAACILLEDGDKKTAFAIHHYIKLNPNTPFNLFALTDSITYRMYISQDYSFETITLKTPYVYKPITPKVTVSELLGCFYVIKSPDYEFKGEKHDFFELTYVDHGSLQTTVDGTEYTLNTGDLIIYGSSQFHTQSVKADTSCSYLTLLFHLNMDNSNALLNQVFHCNKEVYSILEKIMSRISKSELTYSASFLLCHLQEIILLLLEYENDEHTNKNKITSGYVNHFQDQLLQQILDYIYSNASEPITIDEICHSFSISRSSLQLLFKNNLNISPKNFIIQFKLQKSKELIRDNKYSISEISLMLGFSSIHYFSRTFKQHFNITPSEYAKQILKN